MEEVIDRLLRGDFDYDNGSLDFSCSKLELTIRSGEIKEGSFKILGEPGRYTRGTVTSSDGRMECLTTEFVGTQEEISFCFHGENLEDPLQHFSVILHLLPSYKHAIFRM